MNYMSKKWTLQNAVKKFMPHQKVSLTKNKGNLNKRQFESLLKEMKCYYEVVLYEGKGRDRIIFTDKKRKIPIRKEDKRQFNKGIAPPHSKHLALMVMSKIYSIDNVPRTRNSWAIFFGLISSAEQDILKGIYNVEELLPYKKYLIELGIIAEGEENVIRDIAYSLRNVSQGQLQTVIRQAKELQLISVNSSWKGKVKGLKEPIDIDKLLADEINSTEIKLLKKHGINKSEALFLKNSKKVREFNSEWLDYIKNVKDEEGNPLRLQYIYEVFQITCLNDNAFDVFINTHYPNDANFFNELENEQHYHNKLCDYIVENAQKKQNKKKLESNSKNLSIDEQTKDVLDMFDLTIEEYFMEQKNEDEITPYESLFLSDRYVECVKKVHNVLHEMDRGDLYGEYLQQIKGNKYKSEKNLRLEISSIEETKESTNSEYSHFDIELKHQPELDDGNFKYLEAMEDISKEIYEYEEKYGDKAIEHLRLDSVIRYLTKEVTVEECVAKFQQELEQKKEKERKKWEELLKKEGEPVKWRKSKNDPIEVFKKIRYGKNYKEDT